MLDPISSRTFEDPSDITLTSEFEEKDNRQIKKELGCSGKKIKSMTLLKEKSNKKKSNPKTSHKKTMEEHRQRNNVEHSDEKLMRKKLNFSQKTPLLESQSKKKSIWKQSETPATCSFKKPIVIQT